MKFRNCDAKPRYAVNVSAIIEKFRQASAHGQRIA